MEICEFVEKLLYGDDSFTKGGGVWIGIYAGEKLGLTKHCIPLAAMVPFDDGDQYRMTERKNMKTDQLEAYVWYRMTRKAHRDYTFGKKKQDGTPMFKSKYYKVKEGGGGGISGGRKKGTKQYRCNKCGRNVDVERDDNNNCYCCDCGTKLFG